MNKNFMFLVVLSFLATGSLSNAFASDEQENKIVVYTKPQPFVPTITLNSVYGSLSDVTNVEIKLIEADTDIPLVYMSNRAWQSKLSNEMVKKLLNDKASQTYSAKVTIKSKNDKGRFEIKEETAQILIQG